jgi:hypothetical protein
MAIPLFHPSYSFKNLHSTLYYIPLYQSPHYSFKVGLVIKLTTMPLTHSYAIANIDAMDIDSNSDPDAVS